MILRSKLKHGVVKKGYNYGSPWACTPGKVRKVIQKKNLEKMFKTKNRRKKKQKTKKKKKKLIPETVEDIEARLREWNFRTKWFNNYGNLLEK